MSQSSNFTTQFAYVDIDTIKISYLIIFWLVVSMLLENKTV